MRRAGNNTFVTAWNPGRRERLPVRGADDAHQADRDFFRFTLPVQASERALLRHRVRLLPDDGPGPGAVRRHRHAARYRRRATRPAEVSLANLPAGNYCIEVFGDGGQAVTNPHYVLSSWTPRAVAVDSFESNDTFAEADDLGAVPGLVRRGADRDQPTGGTSCRFSTRRIRTSSSSRRTRSAAADFVRIDFDHTAGDLSLLLYSGRTTPFLLGRRPASAIRSASH